MPCGPRQTAQAYLMKMANSSGGVVFFLGHYGGLFPDVRCSRITTIGETKG
jgi:hypothetical protein